MGRAFDIIYKPTRRVVTDQKPVKSYNNKTNSVWLFVGLVIIIFFIIADMSNGSFTKLNNKSKVAETNSNEKVLGESTTKDVPINSNVSDNPNNNTNTNSKTINDQNITDVSSKTTPNVSEKTESSTIQTDNATEQKRIVKSEVKIRILNGSKISGTAAKVKNVLTQAGFIVDSTGDAKNTYTNTVIYYNLNQKDAAIMVQLALNNQSITLQENSSLTGEYDILVVAGKDNVN